MQRTQHLGDLVESDPEIERTFRRRRKQQRRRRLGQSSQAQNMANPENRPLKDYAAPSARGLRSSITRPNVEANNFELKPALLSMVQQNQFGGAYTEDPNLHLEIFLQYCDTLKLHNVSPDAIRLRLFPFSLRDKARAWLHSLPTGSITTWEQMEQCFLEKYFPPSKTARLRNEITSFAQRDGESLYDAWDRYKGLLQMCPHHGLEKWLIIHTFYNGLIYGTKVALDAAAGGALMNKNLDEAYGLIENIALNHHQWASERGNPRKTPGKLEVDVLDLIVSKVEALSVKVDKMNSPGNTCASCEICRVTGHLTANCPLLAPSS